jgi:hypothetical protein
MAYVIEASHFPKFQKKVAQLNKRGKKVGGGITIENVQETVLSIEIAPERSVKIPAISFELKGCVPVVNGFRLVARIEHTEKGNIISRIDGNRINIGDWRSAKPKCDHCETNRRRRDTFFIENVETGELKQVGRTCLADYIRDADIDRVAAYFMFFASFEKDYNDGFYGASDLTAGYPEVRDFVACACAAVRHDGAFHPSREFNSTARAAEYLYWPLPTTAPRNEKENWVRDQPNTSDFAKANAALVWIASKDATRSEYMWNLQVACKAETITHRTRGLVASLVAAYNRDQGETKAVKKVSGHVGSVGERLKGIVARITMTRAIEGYWGETILYVFEDEGGNKFKWFASSSSAIVIKEGLDVGDDVILTGTVKKHGEYRGVKETILSRCIIRKADTKAA